MRALLELRLTILRRRYGSPLEGAVLLGLCGLAWVGGGAAAGRNLPPEWASVVFSLGWLVLAAALGFLWRRQLYSAKEIELLLPAGVSSRALVAVRGVEALVFALVATAPGVSCAAGYAAALEVAPVWHMTVAWWLASAFALAGVSMLAAWGLAGGLAVWATTWAALGGLGWLAISGQGAGRWLGSALGGSAAGPAVSAACAAGAWVVVAGVVPSGAAVRRARGRKVSGSASHWVWTLARLCTRPLPRAIGSLVQRDLVVLVRGGFPRGRVIALALPFALCLLPVAGSDTTLEGWQLSLMTLMFVGVLGTAAGFLFGVDLPRARERWRQLERVQPVSGGSVLCARWALSAAYAMLLAAIAVGWLASMPDAPPWPRVAAGAALLALVTSFDAVAFGLRCEARGSLVEATGYPLRGGVVAVGFALAAQVHPLWVLLYPLLGFAGEAKRSAVLWVRAECASDHQAAA